MTMSQASHAWAASSRRTFLQVSAAGVVTAYGARAASAARQRRGLSKFTWISPRGTLEVLDDYPYWIGKKMGYFDGLERRDRHAARPVRTAPLR